MFFAVLNLLEIMNIIFFHNNNDYTGSTRVLNTIIETKYAEQKVKVVTTRNKEGFLSDNPQVQIVNVPHWKCGNKICDYLLTGFYHLMFFVIAMYHGKSYSTFYINTICPFSAAIAGAIYRKKIVYHVHEKIKGRWWGGWPMIMEYVFNHVNATRIYVSKYVQSQYRNKENCCSTIELNRLSPSFVEKIHITPIEKRQRKNIVMICSLSKIKGIFNFIRLSELMPEYQFKLVIASDVSSIKKYISCPIPKNLTLYPVQRDIHSFLEQTDLLLNMTIPALRIETFGLTIIEAMAYGIPSIVPNIGGPTEIIVNGENGYTADVTDLSKMRLLIKHILSPHIYPQMVQKALKYSRNYF